MAKLLNEPLRIGAILSREKAGDVLEYECLRL
jgi:hypothetical protein